MKPLVSIVTPVFNNSQSLEECILSVKNQNYTNLEHIIIDGGSTDGTIDIIKKYSNTYAMRWISEKDSGMYDALNKGFRLAKGEIFAWLDSDNYYALDIVEKVISVMRNQDTVDVVYGNVVILKDSVKTKMYIPRNPITFKGALIHSTGGIPVQPGVFFKRKVFEKALGFNTAYRIAGDYDLWLKILKNNTHIHYLNEVFGFYRVGNDALSQSLKGIKKGFKEMIAISKNNGQTLHGYMFLSLKYLISYISLSIKNTPKT